MAIKVTPETIAAAIAEVDWARVDAMTDEDIARQIAEDPDVAPDLTLETAQETLRDDSVPRGDRVRALRHSLGLSPAAFAQAYGLGVRSVEDWEQGRREPDEAAMALLRLIADDPDRAHRVLGVDAAEDAA